MGVDPATTDYKDTTWDWRSLCVPMPGDGSPCAVWSALGAWGYNASTLAADPDARATLGAWKDDTMLEGYVGALGTDAATGAPTSAGALMVSYLNTAHRENTGGSWEDVPNDLWEEKFLALAAEYDAKAGVDGIRLHRFATRSWSDEFGAEISGDIANVIIAYYLVGFYVAASFADCKARARSHSMLTLAVLLCVGVSIAASYGLAGLFGQKVTPLTTVLPFVLLGLGVDDSFVILGCFEQTNPRLAPEERVSIALGKAAVSITVTSLTDFVAFGISISTALPALSYFCAFGMFGILTLYMLQCTFFTACMVIDARRGVAGRADCCPAPCCDGCCKPCGVPRAEAVGAAAAPDAEGGGADLTIAIDADAASRGSEPAIIGNESKVAVFFAEKYAPALLSPAGKVLTLVAFAAITVVGAIGCASLKVESAQSQFVPDASYILDTDKARAEYFGESDGVGFYVVTRDIDYFASQPALAGLGASLEACCSHVREPTSDDYFTSWYNDYVAWLASAYGGASLGVAVNAAGRPTDEGEFYSSLAAYLDSWSGAQHNGSVVWDNRGASIAATRFSGQFVYLLEWNDADARWDTNAEKAVDAMNELRTGVSKLDGGLDGSFVFCRDFVGWEMFKIIYPELVQNVVLCLVVVVILTLVTIANVPVAFMVSGAVILVIVDLLGFMYFWGLNVDNVTVIYVVLAVGLAIDYSAHIGHCFMTKVGATNAERVAATLRDIGAPVASGAFSTFLAVIVLSGSSSYVFTVMFKCFFLTSVLGVGHGLILLPVMLGIFGPPPFKSALARETAHGGGSVAMVETKAEAVDDTVTVTAQPTDPRETLG